MSGFTTRPEIRGTFGVVATTHWLASSVAMGVLEKGGNAFDAAVAAGFTLQVVEPHLNGPLGEAPILVYSAKNRRCDMICGQGVAPEAATIARFKSLGLDLIPGTGLLAAAVPGAFDAWMRLVARLWDDAAFRADPSGARLCRERLPGGRAHSRHDHDRRRAVSPGMAEFRRGLSAGRRSAGSRAAVPQPGAGGDLPPRARRGGSGRRQSRAPDRSRPRRLVSRLCRRGDRPLLPHREGVRRLGPPPQRAPERRRHGALAGPGRSAADL